MIPTFRHRLGAIAPRIQPVMQNIEHQMKDVEDAGLRYQSLRFAEGTEAVDPAALRRLVERFSLRGVVMRGGLPGIAIANTTLAQHGICTPALQSICGMDSALSLQDLLAPASPALARRSWAMHAPDRYPDGNRGTAFLLRSTTPAILSGI